MKVEFKVHGISKGTATVKTEVDGEEVTASLPSLEVELVSVKQRHGNIVLRFVGQEMAEAQDKFKQDGVHVWDI